MPVSWSPSCHRAISEAVANSGRGRPQALSCAINFTIWVVFIMQPEELKQLIESGIPGSEVTITVDEGGHYWVTVVSESFAGQTPLNKERSVHAVIGDAVTSGAIHAIHIKPYTPDEWKTASKMQVS